MVTMASVVILDVQRQETSVSDWRHPLAHERHAGARGGRTSGGAVGEELVSEWGRDVFK